MTRIASITAKSRRLALRSGRVPRSPAPARQRDPAEQAAAAQRSESRFRRVRDATETSFLLNGGGHV